MAVKLKLGIFQVAIWMAWSLGKVVPNFFHLYININKANIMSINMIHQKKEKKEICKN